MYLCGLPTRTWSEGLGLEGLFIMLDGLKLLLLIFSCCRHGAQGTMDGASHSTLDNEFGTHVDEEVIKQILEKGTLQETEVHNPHAFPFLLTSNANQCCKHRQHSEMAPRTTP